MAQRHTVLVVLFAALLSFQAAHADVNPGTTSDVSLPAPGPSGRLRMAIIGDRTTGYDSGLAALETAVGEINLLRPDAVIHIGDFVPGYIRDMAQWERDVERVKEVLVRLEPPFFPIPGNHDVITGTDNPDDRRGEALYKKHFGPLYYSFDCGPAHFVCLDTEESLQSKPRFSAAQIQWLREDLAAATARQIFVFMHKPAWEYAEAGWDEVHDLLRQYPVRAVFAGHFHHYYKSDLRDGIQYYVIGVTGGRLFSAETAGGLEHYCLLSIGADDWNLALVRPGAVLADDYVVAQDYKPMTRVRNLSTGETGIAAPLRSPDLGPVDDELTVFIANPLDVPLTATVRGTPRGGWTFALAERSICVAPRGRATATLRARQAQCAPENVGAPEVEITYLYRDSKGRTVPLVLRRLVPLAREVKVPLGRFVMSLDGRADEAAWRQAATLDTQVWEASPYETGERGALVRVLATQAGLYLFVASPDAFLSGFEGERVLSDAIFVGAVARPAGHGENLSQAPVVVIYPFSARGAYAVKAFWNPKEPAGPDARSVHVATQADPGGRGWRCEAFVPWDLLLGESALPGDAFLFNVGVWDNDGDMFTELRSWAPASDPVQWGRMVLMPDKHPAR